MKKILVFVMLFVGLFGGSSVKADTFKSVGLKINTSATTVKNVTKHSKAYKIDFYSKGNEVTSAFIIIHKNHKDNLLKGKERIYNGLKKIDRIVITRLSNNEVQKMKQGKLGTVSKKDKGVLIGNIK